MHAKEALVVHDQSLKIAHPGKGAFDFPSPSGSSQASPVLGRRFPPIATTRKDQLNATPLDPRSRRIAVVGAVSNEPLGLLRGQPGPARGTTKFATWHNALPPPQGKRL
jgi:hypothetical protein